MALELPHVHVVGVAGVGMNPLAQALQGCGYRVTGSDRFADQGQDLPVLTALRAQGIRVLAQDGSGITPATAAVVVSTAIEADNPDILAAAAAGVPVRHRSEMLAGLIPAGQGFAIAGTSGKTTTTGMAGWLLDACGVPAHTVNGGVVVNWQGPGTIGNVHLTQAQGAPLPWVVEVDESDRSLLRFHPRHAIITTVSADHFPLAETIALFQDFARQVSGDIICGPGVRDILGPMPGLTEEPFEGLEDGGLQGFRWRGQVFRTLLPGRHNALNAFCAVQLAVKAGADPARLAEALPEFRGIGRRLECVNPGCLPAVYDDYAHNPEKMTAAWKTLAARAQRMVGVWRPHGFGPLAAMKEDLATAFASFLRPGDHLYILPVFYAGGTTQRALDSDAFVAELKAQGLPVSFVEHPDAVLEQLNPSAPPDTFLVLGARDPDLPLFARRAAAFFTRSTGL